MTLASLYADLPLSPSITSLYPQQEEAVEWALSRPEPYLFINAPTGSGKTLINTTIGMRARRKWSYLVHTIMLQHQVADTFLDLPVFKGRANFPCIIGEETHGTSITASDAICAVRRYKPGTCEYDSISKAPCGYYSQRAKALRSPYRVVNYALFLRYPYLIYGPDGMPLTQVALCDEAHNVEQAVCDAVTVFLSRRTAQRLGTSLPSYRTLPDWVAWAQRQQYGVAPTAGVDRFISNVEFLAGLKGEDAAHWLVEPRNNGVEFKPIWGAPYVMEKLLGHVSTPEQSTLLDMGQYTGPGVEKAVFTSATLMGAQYTADILGLKDGTWAYLDLPSTFASSHRPINYSPVQKMNAKVIADPAGRRPMQDAIDRLIDYYVRRGQASGVIHAVSNKYRDFILTESRWRGIMTSEVSEHARAIEDNKASVLVAANVTEGWDGKDGLCRFIIMPKVPFPDLGDRRTAIRKDEDSRSYDHRALVAIVQGAGRGVRHTQDHADTWILDEAWRILLSKRGDWLPQSFRDAYHHGVNIPQE